MVLCVECSRLRRKPCDLYLTLSETTEESEMNKKADFLCSVLNIKLSQQVFLIEPIQHLTTNQYVRLPCLIGGIPPSAFNDEGESGVTIIKVM